MSKKSKPQARKNTLEHDLKTFERLPEDTKEQMKLKKREQETTGPEHVVTTRKIQDKARENKG